MKNIEILCWIPFFGLFWLYYISYFAKYRTIYYVGMIYFQYQAMITASLFIIIQELLF
jgi:hypothetical protein